MDLISKLLFRRSNKKLNHRSYAMDHYLKYFKRIWSLHILYFHDEFVKKVLTKIGFYIPI